MDLGVTMPNIALVLKQEIVRLSRKEARTENATTRKAAAQYRRDIAALKRQLLQLQRQVAQLLKRAPAAQAATLAEHGETRPIRFSATGVRAQRNRLGLSQTDFAKLLGVSTQSVYNWESGNGRPRGEQLARLAATRQLGKREVTERLSSQRSAGRAMKRTGRVRKKV
jgi:DNA-binding transcriptional regulator YiaG